MICLLALISFLCIPLAYLIHLVLFGDAAWKPWKEQSRGGSQK